MYESEKNNGVWIKPASGERCWINLNCTLNEDKIKGAAIDVFENEAKKSFPDRQGQIKDQLYNTSARPHRSKPLQCRAVQFAIRHRVPLP